MPFSSLNEGGIGSLRRKTRKNGFSCMFFSNGLFSKKNKICLWLGRKLINAVHLVEASFSAHKE